MAQEILEQTLETPDDRIASSSFSDPSLSNNVSFSRLNAHAPEFVPRAARAPPPPENHALNGMIHHGPPMIHVYHPPLSANPQFVVPAQSQGLFEYIGSGGGGGYEEYEMVQASADPDPREELSEEVVQRITKQVEYYFSDVNLATTEQLMRFISKDPEGFVPISVIASFKKIKALVDNNALLAYALRTSSKLVVSENGKRVRRLQPITDFDVEELQSRIIVAENLPEDHCYQNLMKIFSVVGSVKTIRTCYPQASNGMAAATNRSGKLDMHFGNKLHAFVEYETADDAEKAVSELNDERNWRSGLRVRLLYRCMTKNGSGRGKKGGHVGDGNGEEDVSTSNQPNEKQEEDPLQPSEASNEHADEESLNDKDGGARRAKARGRGGRGRGRGGQNQHNNCSGVGHTVGTPPSVHIEQPAVAKQPPGPRMPDGRRGFTMGRGKLLSTASMAS